jgi:anti-sigma factor RsiW
MLRATMYSQPEAPDYDRAELLASTAITMPNLPESWEVTDVQVYPSKFGPSVEMAINADDLGTVSLFAARPGHFLVKPVAAEHIDDITTAHWQIGEVAFALVGRADLSPLRDAAVALSETLY